MNTNLPNFHMLRIICISSKQIKDKYPESDQMPKGAICPGYDIGLLPALGVLKYIHGITSQWSCQGNHKEYISSAYILLAPDNFFPEDLVALIYENGLMIYEVADYNDGVKTNKTRCKICSNWDREDLSNEALIQLNQTFIDVINKWAKSEIKKHIHLVNTKGSPTGYFNDFIQMYT